MYGMAEPSVGERLWPLDDIKDLRTAERLRRWPVVVGAGDCAAAAPAAAAVVVAAAMFGAALRSGSGQEEEEGNKRRGGGGGKLKRDEQV